MCNSFFYEFRVFLSVKVFKLVCCTAATYTTEAKGWLTLIGVLLSLAGGEGGGGAMVCLVVADCNKQTMASRPSPHAKLLSCSSSTAK
jgi:hypothetical protein